MLHLCYGLLSIATEDCSNGCILKKNKKFHWHFFLSVFLFFESVSFPDFSFVIMTTHPFRLFNVNTSTHSITFIFRILSQNSKKIQLLSLFYFVLDQKKGFPFF